MWLEKMTISRHEFYCCLFCMMANQKWKIWLSTKILNYVNCIASKECEIISEEAFVHLFIYAMNVILRKRIYKKLRMIYQKEFLPVRDDKTFIKLKFVMEWTINFCSALLYLLKKRFISHVLQFLMLVKIDLTLNHSEIKAFKKVTR